MAKKKKAAAAREEQAAAATKRREERREVGEDDGAHVDGEQPRMPPQLRTRAGARSAAQAAHVVRIILRWRGVRVARAS